MFPEVTAEVSDVTSGRHSTGLSDGYVGIAGVDQMVLKFLHTVLRKQIGEIGIVRQQVQGKELLVDYVWVDSRQGSAGASTVYSVPDVG